AAPPHGSRVMEQGEHEFPVGASADLADVDTRVLKHDDTFLVCDRRGDLLGRLHGQLGLFHDGMRHLSRFRLRVGGQRMLLLGSPRVPPPPAPRARPARSPPPGRPPPPPPAPPAAPRPPPPPPPPPPRPARWPPAPPSNPLPAPPPPSPPPPPMGRSSECAP